MTDQSYSTLLQAWALSAIPMLVLPLALLTTLLLSMPPSYIDPTYSNGQPLGTALFSTVPATQLTFMSSASSTLATALLPALMSLYSFIAASSVVNNSDFENDRDLPSPYQFSLFIQTLSGSILGVWSFFRYRLGSKSKRFKVVPDLWKSVAVLVLVTLLAFADVFNPRLDSSLTKDLAF